ncbi:LysR family transcriptional regulator [Herbaspirillum sp. AP02]|uniref:LysR family transcriptional regulator n=1 Tax=unclassified Herbaspirillum TaxID=2624150 RepID=UPI0015DAC4D4|nr:MULTISPECIES: LysR family transcriptional regulator [unclassified Herbaspirillum]MBG7621314.1 LysR family transcriptional regulator [Herbaspirillum sp. AP02]NZD66863.1 LysR family transcriptional regulator [Herbaspirillum sp. AP21]
MIELRHLTYFRTVAETLHFGRAAELLHISQPPLTRQIAALERELGAQLFDRSKRAVQLTSAGKYFYRDTTEIFKALERAKRNVSSSSTGKSGALKVGFMMSSAYNILPSVTRHYSAAYPEVDMRLTEYVPNLLATDIEDEKVDVGIMYRPEDCSRLDSHTIYAEPLLAVLPREHRLAGKEAISAAELADDPFVSIPRTIAPVVFDLIIKHCQARGFRPRIVLEANLQQTIVNLVGEGLGVALVPTSMQAMHLDTTVFKPLVDAPLVEVAVIWNKENTNPCIRTFADTAVEVWRKMQPTAP